MQPYNTQFTSYIFFTYKINMNILYHIMYLFLTKYSEFFYKILPRILYVINTTVFNIIEFLLNHV